MLVGEDQSYWYCASPARPAELESAFQRLEKAKPELTGESWRLRKRIIDVAGCLARNGTVYEYGAKVTVLSACPVEAKVDCSGLYAHAVEVAAGFVADYYCTATRNNALRLLQTNAQGQAEEFARYGAFRSVSSGYNPLPGDEIFFSGTDPARTGITHVAIYLGTASDGSSFIIEASASKRKVVIGKMGDLVSKIAGYGDVARLYAAHS